MFDWTKKLFSQDEPVGEVVDPVLMIMLQESLRECKAIYKSSAQLCIKVCPERIDGDRNKFVDRMLDLHRGLLVKILMEIAQCDMPWNAADREVAKVVLHHVWGLHVSDDKLVQALRNVCDHAEMLKWSELVKPFAKMPPLADKRGELNVSAMRIANFIAKADGQVTPAESSVLRSIQDELETELGFRKQTDDRQSRSSKGKVEIDGVIARLVDPKQAVAVEDQKSASSRKGGKTQQAKSPSPQERQKQFDKAMKELDQLIGLEPIKRDIRELVAFLKIQVKRKEHKLPATQISLHTVFKGNPGTGKTTVARLLGRIFCGLDILDKGHTVETDRSGLVAKYAGQTGPRTHERIDEALDGLLFIDEAYSLVADQGEDLFGDEAIQALLKRMEDDRDRLIVILAGYPTPMQLMLRSNPGLSSRFQRTFSFPDFSAKELLRIFYLMCKKYQYQLPKPSQRKLYAGFQYLIDRKDEHFGNGRLARNTFEKAIRRLATRIVNVAPLTREILTTLEPEDIEIEGVPAED